MADKNELLHFIRHYRHKANVLRVIHSRQAEVKRKRDLSYTLAIIVLGAIITFVGFMGATKLVGTVDSLWQTETPAESASPTGASSTASAPSATEVARSASHLSSGARPSSLSIPASNKIEKVSDLAFNLAVLLLFVASLLNLIYRWKEEAALHFQGVIKLTHFLNWLDEVEITCNGERCNELVKKVRGKYQVIVESLPPNSDKAYKAAKTSMKSNDKRSDCGDAAPGLEYVRDVIKASPAIMLVLRQMRALDGRLWLGGGVIRNAVWDDLTSRNTRIDDFDVVYYDSHLEKSQDKSLEENLRSRLPPGFAVSVKNQARMHLVTGEEGVSSLANAVAAWPETATSIAVRLSIDEVIEVLAPHGLKDLLSLIVRPSPAHAVCRDAFERRKASKQWKKYWPELAVE
ncbi:nucleotidyltransferase family protein [Dyella sp.]|uniref:nucleotidyltransferase family protein n=1 Tax=Dyella sp. TaxID=1869338 RepID=UPI003F81DE97